MNSLRAAVDELYLNTPSTVQSAPFTIPAPGTAERQLLHLSEPEVKATWPDVKAVLIKLYDCALEVDPARIRVGPAGIKRVVLVLEKVVVGGEDETTSFALWCSKLTEAIKATLPSVDVKPVLPSHAAATPSELSADSTKASSFPEPHFDLVKEDSATPEEYEDVKEVVPKSEDEKPSCFPQASIRSRSAGLSPQPSDEKVGERPIRPQEALNPWRLDITLTSARSTFLRKGPRGDLRKRYSSIDFSRQPRVKIMDNAERERAGQPPHNDLDGGCQQNLTRTTIYPDDGINILPRKLGEPFTYLCNSPFHLLNVDDNCAETDNGALACLIKRAKNQWLYWGEVCIHTRGAITGHDWRQLSPDDQEVLKKRLKAKIKMNNEHGKFKTDRDADRVATGKNANLTAKRAELAASKPAPNPTRAELTRQIERLAREAAEAATATTKCNPLRPWGLVGKDIDRIVAQLNDPSNGGIAINYAVFRCIAFDEVKMNRWCDKRDMRLRDEALYPKSGVKTREHQCTDEEDNAEKSGSEDETSSSGTSRRRTSAPSPPAKLKDESDDSSDAGSESEEHSEAEGGSSAAESSSETDNGNESADEVIRPPVKRGPPRRWAEAALSAKKHK